MNLTKRHGDNSANWWRNCVQLTGRRFISIGYRAGGGSLFRTPRVHPCEITCVSFHKKGEGRARERDCQQDADNGDDPILPPRQPRSREISLLPIQRIRALPTRVSRRVTTPFLRVPRKRGRETTKLPRVSLSLSISRLFPGRVPSFPIPRVPLSPFLLSCWRRRKQRRDRESRRTWFLLVPVPPTKKKVPTQTRYLCA